MIFFQRFLKYLLFSLMVTILINQGSEAAGAENEFDARLAVWVRLGDLENGMLSLEENQEHISRVLVSDHCIDRKGVALAYRVKHGATKAPTIIKWCQDRGIPVLMGLGNFGGGFSHPEIIVRMLADPEKRALHIQNILKSIMALGYDGVDLDYENLPPTCRNQLTAFVRELGAVLNQAGKQLDITVPPKFSSPGWRQTKAYNWQELPRLVGCFNVMCYDWFIRSGPPGPIIPLDVTKKVVRFARQCPHPERFWIGHPAYGNDWVRRKGNSWKGRYAGAREWQALASQKGAVIQYQARDVGGFKVGPFAHFSYAAAGKKHQVWYGDHKSLAATMALVKPSGLGGIFIWRMGFEDPQIWEVISSGQ
ncbi:hypothetical protein KAR10_10080 [bacterium]|nr:hypothetical protein [bacterium]